MGIILHQGALTFHWPVTVYYEDTDAGGLVYHANYLKFFERARTEMLRTIGVSQRSLMEENTAFVIRHVDIDYLQGARLDEQLNVVTTVAELKKVSIIFCQEIVNLDGKILCKAMVKVACIDNVKMRPKAVPQSMVLEFTESDC